MKPTNYYEKMTEYLHFAEVRNRLHGRRKIDNPGDEYRWQPPNIKTNITVKLPHQTLGPMGQEKKGPTKDTIYIYKHVVFSSSSSFTRFCTTACHQSQYVFLSQRRQPKEHLKAPYQVQTATTPHYHHGSILRICPSPPPLAPLPKGPLSFPL